MLQIPPKEWLEAGQSKLRAELGLDQPAPPPVNEGSVLRALTPDVVRFKHWHLKFGPVSYADGVRMQGILQRLDALVKEPTPTMESLRALLDVLDECADLIHSNMRPLGNWFARLVWRLTNPIKGASEADLRSFLFALSRLRTRSNVELLSSHPESASDR